MGYSLAFVQSLGGTPFPCYITEYMRTVIFRIRRYYVKGGHLAPIVVKETSDFKVSVVTNPASYNLNDGFSDQQFVDGGFEGALKRDCEEAENKAEKTIFVTIQLKENLGLFPATDGQCVRKEYEGKERLFIYDCIDAPGPKPDQKTRSMKIVLAAIRAELEVTGALEKVFDEDCYRADGGQSVYPIQPRMRAYVTRKSPITLHELSTRMTACKGLVTEIEDRISRNKIASLKPGVSDFGMHLEELVDALQLERSRDGAYLRLWYLQLWERTNALRMLFKKRPPELNNNSLAAERNHRHAIAHHEVDKIDGAMFESLQKKVFTYFKRSL